MRPLELLGLEITKQMVRGFRDGYIPPDILV